LEIRAETKKEQGLKMPMLFWKQIPKTTTTTQYALCRFWYWLVQLKYVYRNTIQQNFNFAVKVLYL